MAPLARNCRRSCVARMELRRRRERESGEDEVAIKIQALHWVGGGGGRGKKTLSQGACNKKLPKVDVGGCSRDHWRLRCVEEVRRYLLASSLPPPQQLPCAAARYFAGWYLDECWGTSQIREYLASLVRHYPLTRVRIPATVTSVIHRLSRFAYVSRF